jgi:pilus assembly protein Flp/PilA
MQRSRTLYDPVKQNERRVLLTAGSTAQMREDHVDAFKRFLRDESGATAIEYGLVAAGISIAIITVVNRLGSQLKSTFTIISSNLGTAGK